MVNMNFSQLNAFLLLAQGFNVTETAERLHCTQPSVSIKIKNLEEELGVILFERINNRLYLTPQGKLYKEYASKIISMLDISKSHIKQMNDSSIGEIKFGASHFIGVYLLPKVIAQFKKEYPLVKISMDIGKSNHLIEKLKNHELDFLIMADNIFFNQKEHILNTFLNDPLVLIFPPNHWLSKRKNCSFSDIESELFIIKPKHSTTNKFLFENMGKHLEISKIHNTIEIDSIEGIKQGVIHNLGISILSKISVNQELKYGSLCSIPIKDFNIERGVRYIHYREKYISPAMNNFLKMLTKSNK